MLIRELRKSIQADSSYLRCSSMATARRQNTHIEVFFSYSHKDEDLRNELENHLSILKRQGLISTWHDRKIGAGEEWRGAIDENLNSAQIILLLISADFLASDYCYDIEMDRALERHESGEARVIPVILRPVDWKGAPFGELQALPTSAEPVTSRKWSSRDEAFTDTARGIRRAIEKLVPLLPKEQSEPTMIVVDQMHRGDYLTISEAIAASPPGTKILVKPGVYDEGLVLDKPLEIIGDGDPSEVILRAAGKNVVAFKTTRGRVSKMTLKQNGDGNWYCVDIVQGCLELEECDVTSDSLACVAIHGNAYPKIKMNKIHDGKDNGVFVLENGQGIIEDNDIFGNALSGVEIKAGGNPTVRRNQIHDGNASGVYVYENGQGTIEDNDIFGNTLSGIEIKGGSNPTIRKNKIHDGKDNGVFVLENGQGIIEDNDIFGNTLSGVEIKGGNPTIRRNKIHDGKSVGAFFHENGQGLIEDNDIFGNALPGVEIKGGGNPTIRRNKIHDGKSSGVFFFENGQGLIEDNDIFGNAKAGVIIMKGGNPTIRKNKIRDGKDDGVFILENGQGLIEDNDISGNAFSGIEIKEGSNPTIRRNKIYDGKSSGAFFHENGQGIIEDNDIFGNVKAGVIITKGGNPTIRRNRINKNGYTAIWIYEKGSGVIEENDLRDNNRGPWDISEDSKSLVKAARNIL